YGKDAIGLMVRRSRAELVETIERSREIYGPLGWKLNETEKMWRAPDGARLHFAYLERDADADMYQGHNYTRVYVEEIGHFPSPAPVMKLMATLRSGAGVPVGLRATGNPGGPGHQWVRQRYIDLLPSGLGSFATRCLGLNGSSSPHGSTITSTLTLRRTSNGCGRPAARNSCVRGWTAIGPSPWGHSSIAGIARGTSCHRSRSRRTGCASVRWTGARPRR